MNNANYNSSVPSNDVSSIVLSHVTHSGMYTFSLFFVFFVFHRIHMYLCFLFFATTSW